MWLPAPTQLYAHHLTMHQQCCPAEYLPGIGSLKGPGTMCASPKSDGGVIYQHEVSLAHCTCTRATAGGCYLVSSECNLFASMQVGCRQTEGLWAPYARGSHLRPEADADVLGEGAPKKRQMPKEADGEDKKQKKK